MVKGKSKRAAYTLELNREAVRLVEGAQRRVRIHGKFCELRLD